MVYLTELKGQDGTRGVQVSMDGRAWEPLHVFAQSAMDDDDATTSRTYNFLEKQLDLFGKLCLGRQEYAIHLITNKLEYLTWEECFFCACDERIPPILRAKYVALMTNLFVDVGSNVDMLAEVQLTYVWNELTDNPWAAAANDPCLSIRSLIRKAKKEERKKRRRERKKRDRERER